MSDRTTTVLSHGLLGSISSIVVDNFSVAALRQFFLTDTGLTFIDAVDGSVVKEIADNSHDKLDYGVVNGSVILKNTPL